MLLSSLYTLLYDTPFTSSSTSSLESFLSLAIKRYVFLLPTTYVQTVVWVKESGSSFGVGYVDLFKSPNWIHTFVFRKRDSSLPSSWINAVLNLGGLRMKVTSESSSSCVVWFLHFFLLKSSPRRTEVAVHAWFDESIQTAMSGLAFDQCGILLYWRFGVFAFVGTWKRWNLLQPPSPNATSSYRITLLRIKTEVQNSQLQSREQMSLTLVRKKTFALLKAYNTVLHGS